MKKLIALSMALTCFLILAGCSSSQNDMNLTLEKVMELAEEKGEGLTWSDFEQYDSIETGSGLYISIYDINEDCRLMIGGENVDAAPMYIQLVSTENLDDYVDIRTESIEEFINRH